MGYSDRDGDGMKLNQAITQRLTELLNEKKMTQYQLFMKSGVPIGILTIYLLPTPTVLIYPVG